MFLKSAAAPAVGVALLCLLFGTAPEPWRGRGQALAIAIGFWACSFILQGLPSWPPASGASSLVWVAAWLMLAPWAMRGGAMIRYVVRAVWLLGAIKLAVLSQSEQILNSPMQLRNVLALFFLGWGTWSLVDRSTKKNHPLTTLALASVALTAASLLFVFKGSLLLSQMLTALAVIAGALAAIAWIFPTRIELEGMAPFIAGLFTVILTVGYIYLEIDPWQLVEMAIPFGVLLLKDLLIGPIKSALLEAILCLVATIAPLGWILYQIYLTAGPLY